MRSRSVLFAVLTVVVPLIPLPARAHYVGDEFSYGATQPTAENPRAYYLSNKLNGAWDVKDNLQLKLDFGWTHDAPQPPAPMANFGSAAANIFNFTLTVNWDITDHWNLSFMGTGSPPSLTIADAPITLSVTDPKGNTTDVSIDAQLDSRTWSAGGTISAGYDTAGEGNFETSADLAVTALYFNTDQKYTAFTNKAGMTETTARVQMYCAANPKRCPQGFAQVLANPHPVSYAQFILNGILTETIHQNTDIGLSGSYYIYSQDPTTIGQFGAQSLHTSFSSPGGVAIAPYLYTLSPDITQRIKGFSADLNFQFGQYASNQSFSYDLSLGLKLMYKFNRKFRLWVKANGQRDLDSSGTLSYGGLLALGARVSW